MNGWNEEGPTTVWYFQNPGGRGGIGGGGGPQPYRTLAETLEEQYGVSSECARGMVGSGQRLDSIQRANAQSEILFAAASKYGIDWRLLAAIGVRESGFKNIAENDGAGVGVGVFQLTVSKASGVTAQNAGDLAWAANYAVKMLSDNLATLAAAHPNLTPDQLLQATVASYNFGTGNISGNPNTIDQDTAHNNYGSNVLDLTKCFQ